MCRLALKAQERRSLLLSSAARHGSAGRLCPATEANLTSFKVALSALFLPVSFEFVAGSTALSSSSCGMPLSNFQFFLRGIINANHFRPRERNVEVVEVIPDVTKSFVFIKSKSYLRNRPWRPIGL
jgi:hypothetical protein